MAYTINGLSIVFFWFFGRICLLPLFLLHMAINWQDLILMPLPAVVLTTGCPALLSVLNVIWFKQILRGARKLLKRFDKDYVPSEEVKKEVKKAQ